MNIANLFNEEQNSPQLRRPGQLHAGFVTVAPVLETDGVMVSLPGLTPGHEYGPCPWMPRGVDAPAVGDRVLVGFDDDSEPWVVVWEPA